MPALNFHHSHTQLPAEKLLALALQRREGVLSANQAFCVNTGERTGRSPKDRFIVQDEITTKTVNWGDINQPFSPEKFNALWQRVHTFMYSKEVFINRLKVGADPNFEVPVTVITDTAWQNLFATQLFIRDKTVDTTRPDSWVICSATEFQADPQRDGTNSNAAIIINFKEQKILICGTKYAGEIKKSMFSVLNFLLPNRDVLPMHCSANVGADGTVALFFGLSGTGKTTLSADPERLLIGDDEHGWGKEGVFNFEGGCYAKCINLSQEREPLIWNAIQRGTILENVVLDETTLVPNYDNAQLTENTRAAYPLEFIPNRVAENRGKNPQSVIFLSCDLFGVLPPVSLLTPEQAAYYFLSGYTALIGSTEMGSSSNIKPVFSACFGAPFFPRFPQDYAQLLIERINDTQAQVYLVNTGWTGGGYGQGKRFDIPTTRAIVHAALNGEVLAASKETVPGFNFKIPKKLSGIDSKLLNPRKNWNDQHAFDEKTTQLMQLFIDNFKKFGQVGNLAAAGPKLIAERAVL